MDAIQFVYWLKGHFELSDNSKGLTKEQVKIIEDHINLVLTKVTPTRTKNLDIKDLTSRLYDSNYFRGG